MRAILKISSDRLRGRRRDHPHVGARDRRRQCKEEDRQCVKPYGHSPGRLLSRRREKAMFFRFCNETGQAARGIGPGINVDSVWQHFRLIARGMPMDDDFAKIFSASEKGFADPEQVFRPLAFERDARFHAGVAKEIIADDQRVFKR